MQYLQFRKTALAVAVMSVLGFGLTACNDDNDADTTSTPAPKTVTSVDFTETAIPSA